MNDIRSAVLEVLHGIAPEVKDVRDDEDLREALELDSMDFLRFVVGLHDALGVTIPEKDYPRLSTMDAVVRYLREAAV